MKDHHKVLVVLAMICLIATIKIVWAAYVYDDWTCAFSHCRRFK